MKRLDEQATIDRAYGQDIIQLFPEGMYPEQLTHTYLPERVSETGKQIPIDQVHSIIEEVKQERISAYEKSTGIKFNSLTLGKDIVEVRNGFLEHPAFREAVTLLGVDFDEAKPFINLPWWNEKGVGESKCEINPQERTVHLTFVPSHSLETQLTRAGFDLSVKPSAVDGIILAKPDNESQKGYVTLGVRGGASYPNTYHLMATGALRASSRFKEGKENIYDLFRRDELLKELGDVADTKINRVIPFAKVKDYIINKGGSTYLFIVETDLTKEEIRGVWEKNDSPDKKEFSEIFFIPANKNAINDFLNKNYRGIIENRYDRKDNERYLINPGAVDLCAFGGISPAELKTFYRLGKW